MNGDMENLVSIGRFASVSRLSQKALRLYGDNGLLPPAWVDPDSGYRYYLPEQLRVATMIGLLRRGGVPLADIRAFLRDPTLDRLERFEQRTNDELAERRRALHHARRILKEEAVYDVLTKQVAEQRYVSSTQRVLVPELERLIVETLHDLSRDRVAEAPPFVLYHGPVNAEEDGPIEVCLPTGDGDLRLPAGEVAFTEVRGAQCEFPAILAAYESVYGWAKANGREPDGPPREIYLDDAAGETARMEIALPLR